MKMRKEVIKFREEGIIKSKEINLYRQIILYWQGIEMTDDT